MDQLLHIPSFFERKAIIVGSNIIGSQAGEIIGEAVLAIKMKLGCKNIFDTIDAHPPFPESIPEAVSDISSEPAHLQINCHYEI